MKTNTENTEPILVENTEWLVCGHRLIPYKRVIPQFKINRTRAERRRRKEEGLPIEYGY